MSERIRYYTDENVSKAVVNGLRQRGVDVLTTQEADMMGATDEEHLAFAKSEERVIFTQDDDFLRLHARGESHVGMVYGHQQLGIGEVVRGLMLIYQVMEMAEMENHVEFL